MVARSAPTVQRRLAAIVAADVAGYTRLMERHEAETLAHLKVLRREVIEPILAHYGGRIVDLKGDGAIIEFGSVVAAVEAAVEVQYAVAAHERDRPDEERIRLRIGINLGDVIVDEDVIYGDGVNLAARLESLSEPGGILISGWAFDHLQGKLDLPVAFIGEHRVKNIDRPVRIYQVWLAGTREDRPERPRPPRWRQKATALLAQALFGRAARRRSGEAAPNPSAPLLPDEPSIAVLPFANTNGEAAQDPLGDGLTEDIITQLARYRNLLVIARSSTSTYKGRRVDIRQVGRELGVRYVVEGSIRRGGDKLRVSAQLIEAASGRYVWAQSYDRPAADLLAVQDEITQSIVGELLPHLRKAESEAAFRCPTRDMRAYHLLRRGIEHKQVFTKEDNLKARALFGKAVALDPNYAEAYAHWAFADHLDYLYELSGPARAETLDEGLLLLGKAQRLDPSCPVIYQALSQIYMAQARFDEMLAAAEKALALGPSDAENWIVHADALGRLGRCEEGIAAAERALRLNPLAPPYYPGVLSYQLYAAEHYAEAVRILTPCTACRPSHPSCHIFLALSLLHLGRVEEARTALARTALDFPNLALRNYLDPKVFADRDQPRKIWADLRGLGVGDTPPGM